MEQDAQLIEDVRNIFKEELAKASENFAAQQRNAAESTETKFSIKSDNDIEKFKKMSYNQYRSERLAFENDSSPAGTQRMLYNPQMKQYEVWEKGDDALLITGIAKSSGEAEKLYERIYGKETYGIRSDIERFKNSKGEDIWNSEFYQDRTNGRGNSEEVRSERREYATAGSGSNLSESDNGESINTEPSSKDGGFSMPKFSVDDEAYMQAVNSGDTEAAQKMVDEAAKNAGYSELMYHGSKSSDNIKVFRDWQYFTENKAYAQRYAGKKLYKSYIKINNLFDTRNKKELKIFNEARREYGLSEVGQRGLPDWTDGYDLSEFIDENELDYDAIVLDEGGDMVNGKPVYRGNSYVVRKSNQIKSADPVTYDDNGDVIPLSERFNEDNKDIRYSIKESFYDEFDKAISGDEYYRNNAVVVGNIPNLFSKYGYDVSKPMTITSKHLKDIVHEKIDGVIKYHGISKEKIINAVEQLETPALVIESPLKKDVLVVFTTETDADNIPIAIYISKNGRAYINSVESDSNHILSIYGRKDTSNFINSAVNDNRLIDGNKKRADELQNILGISLSLPDNILSINSTNIISNPSREVNSLSSKNNDKITSNDGTRFSIRDSEGNQLSSEQAEFFKDSKVRDEDGNLMVVYHGTDKEFTVFDNTKGRANMDIQGMFFSPWEIEAGGYGKNVRAYYLNITNPASESEGYKALKKFQGQNNAGVKAREYLQDLGYDGVADYDEYIAFDSNQIKLVSNESPTENEDIRFSFAEDNDIDSFYGYVIRENQNLRWIFSQYDDIYSSRRLDISLNQDDIDRVARTTLKKYSSKYDVNELSEKLTAVYDYLEQTAAHGQIDSDTISNRLFAIAKDILLRSEQLDTEVYDSSKPAKIVWAHH